jgi:hypothetical protein
VHNYDNGVNITHSATGYDSTTLGMSHDAANAYGRSLQDAASTGGDVHGETGTGVGGSTVQMYSSDQAAALGSILANIAPPSA